MAMVLSIKRGKDSLPLKQRMHEVVASEGEKRKGRRLARCWKQKGRRRLEKGHERESQKSSKRTSRVPDSRTLAHTGRWQQCQDLESYSNNGTALIRTSGERTMTSHCRGSSLTCRSKKRQCMHFRHTGNTRGKVTEEDRKKRDMKGKWDPHREREGERERERAERGRERERERAERERERSLLWEATGVWPPAELLTWIVAFHSVRNSHFVKMSASLFLLWNVKKKTHSALCLSNGAFSFPQLSEQTAISSLPRIWREEGSA